MKHFYCGDDCFPKTSKDLTFEISVGTNRSECWCEYFNLKCPGLLISILLPTRPLGTGFGTCPNAENSTDFTPACF